MGLAYHQPPAECRSRDALRRGSKPRPRAALTDPSLAPRRTGCESPLPRGLHRRQSLGATSCHRLRSADERQQRRILLRRSVLFEHWETLRNAGRGVSMHARRILVGGLTFAVAVLTATQAMASDKKEGGKGVEPLAMEEGPRTLEGYVEQEKTFYDFLKKNHPVFAYEKAGRLVGKYQISDREEEFVEFGGGKAYEKENNRHAAITFRLPMESILDLPNKFVGAKKCGECHPVQYERWARSRHAKVVRFPDELEEIPGK